MFELLIAKILVSVIAVVGLSLIAEHLSPRVAGILAGYPLGTAITLFFVGIEQGEMFAAQSAVYTLAGFTPAILLFFVYHKAALATGKFPVLVAAVVSTCFFLLLASLLKVIPLSVPAALLLTITGILIFGKQFKHFANSKITRRVKLTRTVLLARSMAAAAIVVLITASAALIGEQATGLLSAFPVTAFPFVIIIHHTYGMDHVNTIIKNYPYGLGALVVYVIVVIHAYPRFGVGFGTLLAYALATLYLLLFIYGKRVLKRT